MVIKVSLLGLQMVLYSEWYENERKAKTIWNETKNNIQRQNHWRPTALTQMF